jgi:inosine-uridine nucleoside N-ribohydrolase
MCFLMAPGLNSQVKIIFDTDFGGDADDLGALVMLHNLHNGGECELLAIMSWKTEDYVIPAMDAVNRYYGNTDIPMGIRDKNTTYEEWNYNKVLADALPHKLTNDDVPLAVDLYRKLLADHEDNSIVIVTVGPLKNIEDLIKSGPDQYSELNGKELIRKKVQKFVIMGGHFPHGKGEWNFGGNMPGVTKFVLSELTVPVVFSGWELGVQVRTGKRFNELDRGHPLYIGYRYFSEHNPWLNKYFEGDIFDNASYDQTAVLYAVRGGVGTYWEKVEGGYCVAGENGSNYWVEGGPGNHSYLVLMNNADKIAEIIYSIKLADDLK